MLSCVFGSVSCERVLMFVCFREEAYAAEIARFYETDISPIQKQLKKLEEGGVLVSRPVGRTLLYMFNPRYPFLPELKKLLEKSLKFYKEEDRDALLKNRRRPRRRSKPL